MKIYYNPAYSSSPYRNRVNKVEFGNVYCGDIQLLQRLLFYAGVAYKPVSNEERFTYYHNEIKGKIKGDSLFYKSFETDSSGMSLAVLSWRDALVEVGFDVASYDGDSKKLVLLKQVEPEMLPLGNADYWNMLIKLAEKKRILPEGFCIEVTCKKNEIKPSIAYILDCQQSKGVEVEYVPTTKSVAEGNLGKIQNAILSGVSDKIKLDSEDNTFSYIKFTTEDDILRYVATEPIQENTLYFITKAKRLSYSFSETKYGCKNSQNSLLLFVMNFNPAQKLSHTDQLSILGINFSIISKGLSTLSHVKPITIPCNIVSSINSVF